MNIIYAVISALFGIIAWVCTQTIWQYQYIIQYIAMFLSSWFLVLVFIYQEKNETSKSYSLITPYNLFYVVVMIILLVIFRNYKLSDWKTNTQSFWKLWIVINFCQGILLMFFFKIRDWYTHA